MPTRALRTQGREDAADIYMGGGEKSDLMRDPLESNVASWLYKNTGRYLIASPTLNMTLPTLAAEQAVGGLGAGTPLRVRKNCMHGRLEVKQLSGGWQGIQLQCFLPFMPACTGRC